MSSTTKTKIPEAPGATESLAESVKYSDLEDLQAYKISIRNTGNVAVRDFPIRLEFENPSIKFRILSVDRKTTPAREFGKIIDDSKDVFSRRYVYELLNPGDEDVISILASEKRDLKVYGKGEGVSFRVTSASTSEPPKWLEILLSSTFAGIISLLLFRIFGMKITSKR